MTRRSKRHNATKFSKVATFLKNTTYFQNYAPQIGQKQLLVTLLRSVHLSSNFCCSLTRGKTTYKDKSAAKVLQAEPQPSKEISQNFVSLEFFKECHSSSHPQNTRYNPGTTIVSPSQLQKTSLSYFLRQLCLRA